MSEMIQAYQSLFSNRQSTMHLETVIQLESSIKIELLDELTHPRLRKNPRQKLIIANERIDKSKLNQHEKQKLKELYKTVYENVNSY